ncbi:MAG: glycoside hydrolase family 130 protein [Planctomycetota bacterium]
MERFPENPLLAPEDVSPTRDDLEVVGTFNPGAFEAGGRVGLLVRVAERPVADDPAVVRVAVASAEGERSAIDILTLRRDDGTWDFSDHRSVLARRGGPAESGYLTSLSHLRLAWSDDGRRFDWSDVALRPTGELERFGIEDPRVTRVADRYVITCSATSARGICVGLLTTADFRRFTRHGYILPHENKDVCVFPEQIDGAWAALHRPASGYCRPGMWLARSPDLVHWGGHQFVAAPRPGAWDADRIGAGPPPIRTPKGWLAIYHGAGEDGYGLGVMLLDAQDPARVLARSAGPFIVPEAEYERVGYTENVVFSNGLIARSGGELTVYYGGADRVTAGCRCSVDELLDRLA